MPVNKQTIELIDKKIQSCKNSYNELVNNPVLQRQGLAWEEAQIEVLQELKYELEKQEVK